MKRPADAVVQQTGDVHALARDHVVRRVRIYCEPRRPMSWPEVAATFQEAMPGHWAIQVFPPADRTVDETHEYHLWVFAGGDERLIAPLDISRRWGSDWPKQENPWA